MFHQTVMTVSLGVENLYFTICGKLDRSSRTTSIGFKTSILKNNLFSQLVKLDSFVVQLLPSVFPSDSNAMDMQIVRTAAMN